MGHSPGGGHWIRHKSLVTIFPGVLDAGGEVHEALQALPDCLEPRFAITLAREETAEPCYQSNHFIETWRRLGLLLPVRVNAACHSRENQTAGSKQQCCRPPRNEIIHSLAEELRLGLP